MQESKSEKKNGKRNISENTINFGSKGFLLWGCIKSNGVRMLTKIDAILNSVSYIAKVLPNI